MPSKNIIEHRELRGTALHHFQTQLVPCKIPIHKNDLQIKQNRSFSHTIHQKWKVRYLRVCWECISYKTRYYEKIRTWAHINAAGLDSSICHWPIRHTYWSWVSAKYLSHACFCYVLTNHQLISISFKNVLQEQ